MDAEQVILSRQLPKTGQNLQVEAGDDGFIEAGWWKGRKFPKNKTRFIISGVGLNRVTIDRATGLMWAADGNGSGCNGGTAENWIRSLSVSISLTLAGFTDWRMPNIFELMSIVNFGRSLPATYVDYFPNTESAYYWSSTSSFDIPAAAWSVIFDTGNIYWKTKTDSYYLRSVRGGV